MATTPVATSVPGDQRKTPDERKAELARVVANHVPYGWRVESQADYQAVLVKGGRTSHGLHLFLTIISGLIWTPVWITLAIMHHEKREIAAVDELGHVTLSKT